MLLGYWNTIICWSANVIEDNLSRDRQSNRQRNCLKRVEQWKDWFLDLPVAVTFYGTRTNYLRKAYIRRIIIFQQLLAMSALILAIPVSAATTGAKQPIVVELFTSQGCSSCPPADAYLGELSHDRPDVLPLAFHVTYWNDLGWTDPFSFEGATYRQAAYAKRFRNFAYTPEMVVEGQHSLIGSDRQAAEAAISTARRTQEPAASLSATQKGNEIAIAVGAGTGSANVMLISYDPEHRTAIGRGENNGRTLLEANIVRSITLVGVWAGAPIMLKAALQIGEKAAIILEAPDGQIVGASRVIGSAF